MPTPENHVRMTFASFYEAPASNTPADIADAWTRAINEAIVWSSAHCGAPVFGEARYSESVNADGTVAVTCLPYPIGNRVFGNPNNGGYIVAQSNATVICEPGCTFERRDDPVNSQRYGFVGNVVDNFTAQPVTDFTWIGGEFKSGIVNVTAHYEGDQEVAETDYNYSRLTDGRVFDLRGDNIEIGRAHV